MSLTLVLVLIVVGLLATGLTIAFIFRRRIYNWNNRIWVIVVAIVLIALAIVSQAVSTDGLTLISTGLVILLCIVMTGYIARRRLYPWPLGVGLFFNLSVLALIPIFALLLTTETSVAAPIFAGGTVLALGLVWFWLPTLKRCPNCQAVHFQRADFCANCGTALPHVETKPFRLPQHGIITVVLVAMFLTGLLGTLTARGTFTPIRPIPTSDPNAVIFPTPTPIPFVEILIAAVDIPRGTSLEGRVVLRPWPELAAPVDAITNINAVQGMVARSDIFPEQPISPSMMTDDFNTLAQVYVPQPGPVTPRGVVLYDQPVTGEINDITWIDEWVFAGAQGETVTFQMETTGGNLRPFLMLWNSTTQELLTTQHSADAGLFSITATLPTEGTYALSATRARINNGSTAGSYRLTASRGYLVVRPVS